MLTVSSVGTRKMSVKSGAGFLTTDSYDGGAPVLDTAVPVAAPTPAAPDALYIPRDDAADDVGVEAVVVVVVVVDVAVDADVVAVEFEVGVVALLHQDIDVVVLLHQDLIGLLASNRVTNTGKAIDRMIMTIHRLKCQPNSISSRSESKC